MKTNGTSQYDTLLDTFRLGDPTATGLIPQVGLILSDSGSVPFEKIGKIWICGERLEKNIENSWKLRQEICDLSMGFQDLCRNFIVEYIYIYLFRGGSRKLSSESSLVISCAPTWDFSQFATEICYSPMITKQVPGGFMSQLLGFECHICPVAEIQSRREPWPVECFPS